MLLAMNLETWEYATTRSGGDTRLARALEIHSLLAKYNNSVALGGGGWNPLHLRRILGALETNSTLEIVLPAFPAKSANPQKTLGTLPDYGEVLALNRLNQLCEDIQRIHAPGAKLTICSDGRVFSDLVLVNDSDVTEYRHGIEEILRDFQFDHLSCFHMEDIFPKLTFSEMREKLLREYARPIEEIRSGVKANPVERHLFNGIHRFLFEDRIQLEAGKSRNRLREETKALAYEVIQRSNSWSGLVEKYFPHALRLSIHPQPRDSAKIGFRLVESENAWATPWHSVVLESAAGFQLVKRSEAEASHAQLIHCRGKYPYFRARGIQ